MDSNERLSFKINIADRSYPLRVPPDEQRKMLKAASMINEKVDAYKGKYANKDIQDFIAMAALQLATKLLEQEPANDAELTDELAALNKKLDGFLNQQK